MEWTRSETLALAAPGCTRCHGIGIVTTRHHGVQACRCVYRSIFRACYARFRECLDKEKIKSHAVLEFSPRGGGRITWGRKEEEFAADFYLVSRRGLTSEEWRVFNYHYLLGADWRLCAARLGLERGMFFHHIYRIEARLGRIFRELEPYGLYPLDEYFQGSTLNEHGIRLRPSDWRRQALHTLLDVPVRRAA